jgi:DNA-binding transcriptional ArsR family regulator
MMVIRGTLLKALLAIMAKPGMSIRELSKAIGLGPKSYAAAHYHVRVLEALGLVTREDCGSRSSARALRAACRFIPVEDLAHESDRQAHAP